MSASKRQKLGPPEISVSVPFKEYIPAGTSLFEIPIPAVYRDREFSIAFAMFFAEFYSNQALLLDLDTDVELDEQYHYQMHLKCIFINAGDLYPKQFSGTAQLKTPWELIQASNAFFEVEKPEGIVRTGIFYDWTDTRKEGVSFKQWIENDMAEEYYLEDFNEKEHFNFLPLSVRNMDGVNNYLFPTNLTKENLAHLRFRLWVAPNMSAVYSNDLALSDLGFSPEQIGERTKKQQYIILNDQTDSFKMVEAEDPPQVKFKEMGNTRFRMSLRISNLRYACEPYEFFLTRRDLFNNQKYEAELKAALEHLEYATNLRVGIKYNPEEKMFEYQFPRNDSLHALRVVQNPGLSERLGFGLVQDIGINNSAGKKIKEATDTKDARDKATALANDAGIVVISDENSSSSSTVGIYERVLGTMYPDSEGKMKFQTSAECGDFLTLKIAPYMPETQGVVYAQFKLLCSENRQFVPLVWKVGSWIQGSLKSI